MGIVIKKAGVLDTVQDLGRFGHRRFGINPNGAMDRTSVRLLNTILGNNETEAVLELHFPASAFEFEENVVFSLGGADFGALLDKKAVETWRVYRAERGATLKFTEKNIGNRCYLGIRGGLKIEPWLGSNSTNLVAEVGGYEGRQLSTNDRLSLPKASNVDLVALLELSRTLRPRISESPTVRITKGPEYCRLTALSEHILFDQRYAVSADSNRMGFRLEGESLHVLDDTELLSSGVDFGTIQLLPNGQLVVLMADHQTTGGYPRIANVIEADLHLLGQLGPGNKVKFELISIAEAEAIRARFERDLSFLRMGVRFGANEYAKS